MSTEEDEGILSLTAQLGRPYHTEKGGKAMKGKLFNLIYSALQAVLVALCFVFGWARIEAIHYSGPLQWINLYFYDWHYDSGMPHTVKTGLIIVFAVVAIFLAWLGKKKLLWIPALAECVMLVWSWYKISHFSDISYKGAEVLSLGKAHCVLSIVVLVISLIAAFTGKSKEQ